VNVRSERGKYGTQAYFRIGKTKPTIPPTLKATAQKFLRFLHFLELMLDAIGFTKIISNRKNDNQ